MFPNSLYDLEITLLEPLLCWIPTPMKTFSQRFLSWIYSPMAYFVLFFEQFLKRIVYSIATRKNIFGSNDAFPLIVPFAMYLFGNACPSTVFTVWMQIIAVSSFVFSCIGLHAGHHHPDSVHDGDKLR